MGIGLVGGNFATSLTALAALLLHGLPAAPRVVEVPEAIVTCNCTCPTPRVDGAWWAIGGLLVVGCIVSSCVGFLVGCSLRPSGNNRALPAGKGRLGQPSGLQLATLQ